MFRFVRRLRRRLRLLPATPFFSASLSSLRPPISVGPRFECLQTNRCALLWSVSYPCSIFHCFQSRLFNASALHLSTLASSLPLVRNPEESLPSQPFGRFPSSSAPAFRSLVHSRGCQTWSELPLQLHNFCSFLSWMCSQLSLFGLPVGSGRF
jgi:hypothetical protein